MKRLLIIAIIFALGLSTFADEATKAKFQALKELKALHIKMAMYRGAHVNMKGAKHTFHHINGTAISVFYTATKGSYYSKDKEMVTFVTVEKAEKRGNVTPVNLTYHFEKKGVTKVIRLVAEYDTQGPKPKMISIKGLDRGECADCLVSCAGGGAGCAGCIISCATIVTCGLCIPICGAAGWACGSCIRKCYN